jgi:hypothetical protein
MKRVKVLKKLLLGNYIFYVDENVNGGGNIEISPPAEQVVTVEPEKIASILGKSLSGDYVSPEEQALIDPDNLVENNENKIIDNNDLNSQQYQVDNYWNVFKSKIQSDNNEWDYPEEIKTGKNKEGNPLTADEKFDLLLQTIYKYTKVNEDDTNSDDDFIKEYKEQKTKEGFNFEKFIDSKKTQDNILKLEGKDFLVNYYSNIKNEDGTSKYSKDDLEDYISKLNKIQLEKEVEQLKGNYVKTKQENITKQEQEKQQKIKQQFDNWENDRKTKVNKISKMVSSLDKIGEIPFSESDKQEFNAIFDKLTQYNDKTGNTYLSDYLQSDETRLYKMLYLAHKIDSGEMSKHFSNIGIKIKEDILDKLGIKPNIQQNSNIQLGNPVLPGKGAFI